MTDLPDQRSSSAEMPDDPLVKRMLRVVVVAWAFVAAQIVLIGVVVALPQGHDWPLSPAASISASMGTWAGIGMMIVAASALGRGLTAAPLPNARARLRTTGAYRFARHPVYTGLLVFTVAQVFSSRNYATAAVGAALVVLINVKARWEERHLKARFAEYEDYARSTPRFVPGWPAPRRG